MRFLMLIANSFLGLPSRGCVPRNMKGGVLVRPGVGIIAVLLFGLSACASYDRGIEAKGGINGHEIATTVDTPEAKYYLERYLEGLGVWSRSVMASIILIDHHGRHYGTGTTRQRQDDARHQSGNTAIASFGQRPE